MALSTQGQGAEIETPSGPVRFAQSVRAPWVYCIAIYAVRPDLQVQVQTLT